MWSEIANLFRQNKSKALSDKTYRLPDNTRVYVLGDVHGCYHLLKTKIDQLYADLILHSHKRNIFIGLGDYVDRGSDSQAVIDAFLNDMPDYVEKIFLKGNHELFMVGFMNDPLLNALWLEYGGIETLRSYGVSVPSQPFSSDCLREMSAELLKKIPQSHIDFLASLKNSFEIGDYFFVHAGINPQKSFDDQTEYDLTSIRKPFIESNLAFEKRVIHGHTPCDHIEILPQRINLDTGAYLSGNLSLAAIENDKFEIIR